MGTDIHFWVEQKTEDGWKAIGGEGDYYNGVRSIPLFALLADVRISRTWIYDFLRPIAQPRGFPADLSAEAARYFNPADPYSGLHSASWYTLTELLEYNWPADLQWFVDGPLERIHALAAPGRTPNDIRIVFAFDN